MIHHFYPRSPCGERQCARGPLRARAPFLSTLSLRRATVSKRRLPSSCRHFYPRSPCGERLPPAVQLHISDYISIHALLAESDIVATYNILIWIISIHALLAESDRKFWALQQATITFLSTLSLRRATIAIKYSWGGFSISIHALLAESDLRSWKLV